MAWYSGMDRTAEVGISRHWELRRDASTIVEGVYDANRYKTAMVRNDDISTGEMKRISRQTISPTTTTHPFTILNQHARKTPVALAEWKCPVCISPLYVLKAENVRVLNCGHLLCDSCHVALVRHGMVVSSNASKRK
jgi:hypothetical protein